MDASDSEARSCWKLMRGAPSFSWIAKSLMITVRVKGLMETAFMCAFRPVASWMAATPLLLTIIGSMAMVNNRKTVVIPIAMSRYLFRFAIKGL